MDKANTNSYNSKKNNKPVEAKYASGVKVSAKKPVTKDQSSSK
jgi:hypothetical protein